MLRDAAVVGGDGADGWSAQGVAAGYERARGLRARRQQADGDSVSASKTVAAPIDRPFAEFVDEPVRDRRLEPGAPRRRTALPHRLARFDVELPEGVGTRIEVSCIAKGDAKAGVAVQASTLTSRGDAERWRVSWEDRQPVGRGPGARALRTPDAASGHA